MSNATRRILCGFLVLAAAAWARAQSHDFSFLHLSDSHFSPHVAGQTAPALRGAATLSWICEQATQPQELPDIGARPAPAFALLTGDIFEYGAIDDTWSALDRAFGCLTFPLYVLAGNHDNTWHAIYPMLRERHGGENYAITHGGCRFLCISSASPQEPVPTIDGKTRAWLKRELDATPADVPIFLALHHPPRGSEFAPAEYATLIDLLRDHNVALLLYGHGHNVVHNKLDGLDGVMGGSTFGGNAGYGLVDVADGTLRVLYRYQQPRGEGAAATQWRTVLEKPIADRAPQRLFTLRLPNAIAAAPAAALDIRLETDAARELRNVTIEIDGREVEAVSRDDDLRAWRVPVEGLTPGRHLLAVRATTAGRRVDVRTATFSTADPAIWRTWQDLVPAGVKAGPVLVDRRVIVARTDGIVEARAREDGRVLWQFTAGGEVLGTPALLSRTLVFGSGDGHVYALDVERGRMIWKRAVGVAVYGTPVIADNTVYIGDNGGRLHALDVATGEPRWTFTRAEFGIEAQPCVWDDLVVFGAWDGYVYAVKRRTGEPAWKVWGPKSSEGGPARYYAPADCGPVALGERLYVCDRGYYLAAYDPTGQQVAKIAEKVAGIATDGRFLYARTIDNRVIKFDAEGTQLWEQSVPAGRFPIPPACADDSVVLCSNTGLLSVLDAEFGVPRWQFQVTPGFFVMAPVAVDADGFCYAAGMDGTLVRVRPNEPNAVKPKAAAAQ